MAFCNECGKNIADDLKFCPHCGKPNLLYKDNQSPSEDIYKTKMASGVAYGQASFESLPNGYIIDDRYEVKSKIGQGGFGAVYRVYDKKMEIDKALKVLPEVMTHNKEAMQTLLNEATTMAKLTNDNIVRVYEFSKEAKLKYLDMEFVDGGSLIDLKVAKSGKLSEEEVLKLAKEIANGLSYAHKQNVIHKDIKPANILLTKSGKPKIMDFGISETVRVSMSRINQTSSSGTLVYMSPEQIKGKEVGREADIYSFGAMLYELLSGNPPFYRGDINHQILNEKPENIEGVSNKTNQFLQKCLAKDYSERFRSFDEILEFLGGKEIDLKIKNQKWKEKETKPISKNFFIAAAVLLLCIGGYFLFNLFRANLKVEPKIANFEKTKTEMIIKIKSRKNKLSWHWQLRKESNWLKLEKSEGNGDSYIKIFVNRLGMQKGIYKDNILLISDDDEKQVPVQMEVEPILEIDTTFIETGKALKTRINIENKGTGKLNWEAKSKEKWLTLKKVDESKLDISISEEGLETNKLYTDEIDIISDGGNKKVPVSMKISPLLITNIKEIETDKETSKVIRIENQGRGKLEWEAKTKENWISLKKINESRLEVNITEEGLETNKVYSGEIEITSNGGTVKIPVKIKLTPEIYVAEKSIRFFFNTEKEIKIQNIGRGKLQWELVSPPNWLIVEKISDTKLKLSSKMSDSSKSGELKIKSNGGDISISISIILTNTIGMEFVLVKAGSFQMGSNEYDDEKPIHKVNITKDFYIGKYEVTQGQWKKVMGNNPSYFSNCGEDCPVEKVSWNDAQEFIKKLNEKEGINKYRLPTEAEWEYAARGGNKSNGYKYSGSNDVNEVAEYYENNNKSTKPVGGRKPNELGIYDMSGNVWEWVEDSYNSSWYSNSPTDNPCRSNLDESRVLRGGSWDFSAGLSRVAYRDSGDADKRSNDIGFRVARTF